VYDAGTYCNSLRISFFSCVCVCVCVFVCECASGLDNNRGTCLDFIPPTRMPPRDSTTMGKGCLPFLCHTPYHHCRGKQKCVYICSVCVCVCVYIYRRVIIIIRFICICFDRVYQNVRTYLPVYTIYIYKKKKDQGVCYDCRCGRRVLDFIFVLLTS